MITRPRIPSSRVHHQHIIALLFFTLLLGCENETAQNKASAKAGQGISASTVRNDMNYISDLSNRLINDQQADGWAYATEYADAQDQVWQKNMSAAYRAALDVIDIKNSLRNDYIDKRFEYRANGATLSQAWLDRRSENYQQLVSRIGEALSNAPGFEEKRLAYRNEFLATKRGYQSMIMSGSNTSELVKNELRLLTELISYLDNFQPAVKTADSLALERPAVITGPWRLNRIIDGDTIEVLCGTNITGIAKDTVRLLYIDTPEMSQPGGADAKVFLSTFISRHTADEVNFGLKPELELLHPNGAEVERDIFGRILAYVYVGDEQINYHIILNNHSPYVTKFGVGIFDPHYKRAAQYADQ